MKFSRHKSIKTIMKYIHPTHSNIEEVTELAEIDLSEIESGDSNGIQNENKIQKVLYCLSYRPKF
jgi:hypothetical protein